MERGSLLRWILIGAAIFLFFQFGYPLIFGSGGGSQQPFGDIVDDTAPEGERPEAKTCRLAGPRFSAEMSSRGAVLTHVWMGDPKYTVEPGNSDAAPIDLVSTTLDGVMPLRTDLRSPFGDTEQVPYNDLDWTLVEGDGTRCVFRYEDERVRIDKTIATTERAFELTLDLAVTNKAEEPQKHRLAVQQTDWRTDEETSGSLGREGEFMTRTELYSGDEALRFTPGDFEPDDFEDEDITDEKWRRAPGGANWAAVSSSFFTKAIFHLEGASQPHAEAQIEHVWDSARFADPDDDPNYGYIYRARLAYPTKELQKDESASYRLLAYVGPKERKQLETVGAGFDVELHGDEILDLGYFGFIGKILIRYLYWLYGLVGHWGIAICLLTITVKVTLFPLSISQIKSSMAMRKLKPQMDEINEKYKEDATQRGLKMQELWRKNNVTNPMLGCLPVLLQMPVWFALYRTLQTAVELYHVPFLWWADMSAPDPYYVLPILLGCSSFLQQRLMPMQGDAMQQKMMRYMMPVMFTIFMLFLPAGLGIYFLTNTWLGIGQQLAVERFFKSRGDAQKKTSDTEDAQAETAA